MRRFDSCDKLLLHTTGGQQLVDRCLVLDYWRAGGGDVGHISDRAHSTNVNIGAHHDSLLATSNRENLDRQRDRAADTLGRTRHSSGSIDKGGEGVYRVGTCGSCPGRWRFRGREGDSSAECERRGSHSPGPISSRSYRVVGRGYLYLRIFRSPPSVTHCDSSVTSVNAKQVEK